MNIVLRNDISTSRLSNLNCVQDSFQELDISKDQNRKTLIDLLKLEGNDVCVDCGAKGKRIPFHLSPLRCPPGCLIALFHYRSQMGVYQSRGVHMHRV